ncbi:MAG: hypothetical protein SGCHY_000740, partial [Lobulomycetales sp.]
MSYSYGLDAELEAKRKEKYDPGREQEAQKWIESTLNEPFMIPDDFHESLKSGVTLCKLASAVTGKPVKFNTSKMPFKQMENINEFLTVCDSLGLPKSDQFMTVDLFEKKNPNQVVDTIFAFSRYAAKNGGYTGPILGPKLAEKNARNFSEEKL